MSKVNTLIKKLKNPPREFSAMPFWFINDALSDEEIIRQMTDFNAKGINGVVLHPRIGIPKELTYLSDEFMHYMKTAVDTAARLDMKVVLYDEAMYPSGSAHGQVVASNPAFASQCIIMTDDETKGKLIAKTDDGKFIVQLPSNGHIRGIHFGEDDGQKDAPLAADLLNQDSVNKFIELTHERYYSILKKYFGNTVIGFFTDEPSVLGRGGLRGSFAWTWGFEDVMTNLGAKLSDLSGLFTGEDNKSVEIYKKAIFARECDIYYKSLSDWCENHGIALMGHPHRGDDIECERFFHIPGQDVVLRMIQPETGGMIGYESAQGKCSSDAARVMGRRRNSNECYGACCRENIPWYFTGGDLKWYTDWLGVRGVNFFIPHAFYYSVTDKRKDERPPDVGPNSIWWRHFDTISMYLKRVSCLMTDAPNTAKVCVMCRNRKMPIEEVVPLYENQVEFNYLPYDRLPEVKDGKIIVGGNCYEYVYCDTENAVSGVEKINGIEDLPYRDVYVGEPCPDLRVSHVVKDGVNAYFLTNEGEGTIDTTAGIAGVGGIVAMDLWSGDVKALHTEQNDGKLSFKLKLERRESVLILNDEEARENPADEKEPLYLKPEFTLISENTESFEKLYKAELDCGKAENAYIKVRAEEMVECSVNNIAVGFSLWNEHKFYVSPYLKDGKNEIVLKVTGSAVNRYTDRKIEYGLL